MPCYNEVKTIEVCLLSWINQTRPADQIVVVNDCSTDGSRKILEKYKDKIKLINLRKKAGNKSFVQQRGLKFIDTDIFIATDADTLMDKYFVERIENDFKNEKIDVVSGYVKSLKFNWLTACREIDYILGQDLHKSAQNYIKFLLVVPGCAGAFKTSTFKKLIKFDHDTLTEDLDFTYKYNENNFNLMYDQEAIVYTQDPNTLKVYINQMRRWYGGGWQNLMKHLKIVRKPAAALELSMVYFEGLLFYPLLFIVPLISFTAFIHMVVFSLLTWVGLGIYSAINRKRIDLLIYSPLYLLLSYINAYIFLEQFVKEVILKKKNLVWYHPERRAIT